MSSVTRTAIGVMAWLALAPALARADDDRIAWEPGSACAPTTTLALAVRELLAPTFPIPPAFVASARIDLRAEGGDPEARVLIVTLPDQVREIRGRACDSLEAAAAVVVALAIDPSALDPSPPPPPPPPIAPRAREHAASLGDPLALRAPSPSLTALGVALSTRVASGTLPDPLPGIVLEGLLRQDALVVRVGGAWLPGSRGTLAGDPSRGADITLATAMVAVCGRLVLSPLALDLCAQGEAGAFVAQGFGVDHPQQAVAAYGALGGAARGSFVLVGPLSLFVEVGGALLLDVPRFVLEGLGPVFAPDLGSIRGSLGLVLQLPVAGGEIG